MNEKVLEWVKFVVGAILFAVMVYIDAYVKDLNIFVMAIPGLLMGLDPSKIIGGLKK